MNSTQLLSATLILLAAATGCDVCGDLDERMCKDLGAEDCALWKENKLTFSDQSNSGGGGRRSGLKKLLFGDSSGVCSSASSDAVYPQMLSSMKQAVGALRKSKQATEAAAAK